MRGCVIVDKNSDTRMLNFWWLYLISVLDLWCYKNFHGCPRATILLWPTTSMVIDWHTWTGGQGSQLLGHAQCVPAYCFCQKLEERLQVVTRNVSTHWSGLSDFVQCCMCSHVHVPPAIMLVLDPATMLSFCCYCNCCTGQMKEEWFCKWCT